MDPLAISTEQHNSSHATNRFKAQMGQLVEQFQQIPASEQLDLIAEIRNLLLDLENVYNHNEIGGDKSILLSDSLQLNPTSDDVNLLETSINTNSESISSSFDQLLPTNELDFHVYSNGTSAEFVSLRDYVDLTAGKDDDVLIGANVAIEAEEDVRSGLQIVDYGLDCGNDNVELAHEVVLPSEVTTEATLHTEEYGRSEGEVSSSETLQEIGKPKAPSTETTVPVQSSGPNEVSFARQTYVTVTRSRANTKAKIQAAMENKTKSIIRMSTARALIAKSKSVKRNRTESKPRAKRKKPTKVEKESDICNLNNEFSQLVVARQKTIELHSKNELFALQVALSTIEELNDKEKYYVNGIRVMYGAVTCRTCGCEFENSLFFEQHACRSSLQKIACKTCAIEFHLMSQFQKHLKNHVRNDCKLCDCHFTKRKLLRKHERLVHGIVEPDKFYHCAHCDRKFIKRPSLYAHLREHANSKIVCMKCGLMCEDENHYKQHMSKHVEEANFHCDKCKESFLRRQQYEQHMAGHNKYDCTLCDMNFSTKKQMAKHRRITHGICTKEEKKHECGVCHKKFQRPLLLQIHKRVHTGEKPVQCSQCEKTFRTSKSLDRHMTTPAHLKACGKTEVKEVETKRSYLCAECGAKFFRKQGLLRHMMQSHSEERPYICEFCDYKGKCKTNLKRHMELHKSERRYVCELCGSTFHALATLKEHHAYIHSEIRGFVCSECGKGFKGRSGLLRHIRSHSDARPYVCECGQSYKRMSHLKRHMMAIHGTVFKSKRVQKIDSEEEQLLLPPPPYPSTNNMPYQLIYNAQKDDVIGSDAITLPVMATNNFLIVSDPEHNTSEMAREVTLEVTTQTVGHGLTQHMPLPQLTPEGILKETGNVLDSSMLHEDLGVSSCSLPIMSMPTCDMTANEHMDTSSIPHDIVVSNMNSLPSSLVLLPSLHHHHHQMSMYVNSVQTLPSMHESVSDVATSDVVTLESIDMLQAELVSNDRKLEEMFW